MVAFVTRACAIIQAVRSGAVTILLLLTLAVSAGAASPDRPLWLGERFEELPFDQRDPGEIGGSDVVSFFYGDPGPEGGAWPIEVQNWSVCDRNPLELDVLPTRISRLRGAIVLRYGGDHEVLSARTNAVLFGVGRDRIEAAVAALRPDTGPPALGAPLPAAQLPRWVLRELKLVRAVVRRSGTGKAARKRLGISRGAIRVRARLARLLGPAAFRGVRRATATPGEVIRDRRALINLEEGADTERGDRRRAARHRARQRRC
jgi:hypothetical protein